MGFKSITSVWSMQYGMPAGELPDHLLGTVELPLSQDRPMLLTFPCIQYAVCACISGQYVRQYVKITIEKNI